MTEFLQSKKVKAMLVGLIVVALAALLKPLGVELTSEQMVVLSAAVTVIVGAYINSQGKVDKAKEKAKNPKGYIAGVSGWVPGEEVGEVHGEPLKHLKPIPTGGILPGGVAQVMRAEPGEKGGGSGVDQV